MSCGIYLIKNKINNKIYIGQSINIEARWMSEIWHGRFGNFKAQVITQAIRKYGIDNFEFIILDELPQDRELLNSREIEWINFFESRNPRKGYNVTYGGQKGHLGLKRSLETGEKISKALSGKKRPSMQGKPSGMTGKTHSIESRQKISKANKGRHFTPKGPMSEECKQKIRDGWTDEAKQAASNRAKNQPKTTGWHHSDEAKKKMSEAKKGRPATNKGVPRTEAQKFNDKVIALKRHLAKGKPCLKFIDKLGNEMYFVSEYEAATKLTGEFAPASLIKCMTDNPEYIPKNKTSLGWKTLQGCLFNTCSQSELIEHRSELL